MFLTRFVAAAVATLALCSAQAETRGLILAIADYPAPATLPGVKHDVVLAKKLAKWMKVPESALTIVQDSNLGLDGFSRTLRAFADSVKPGDEVFLYYSGHGASQEVRGQGPSPQCAQSFVAADMQFFMDKDFKGWLEGLSAKASKLIVFADSCHSGGVVADMKSTRSVGEKRVPKTVMKAVPEGGQACEPVNLARSAIVTRSLRTNSVYIAAARDNEVAWSTSRGSSASMAWISCLDGASMDTDGSGAVTAEELRQCAQQWLDEKQFNQHLQVVGNKQMVLGFDKSAVPEPVPSPVAAPAPLAVPAPVALPQPQLVLPALLDDLVSNGDPKREVRIVPTQGSVTIGRDSVDFDVTTSEPGYLYLLYLGSDGKTLDLLFPNRLDADNFIQAGTHRFPRPTWSITAGGPAGTDRILAIVSPARRNFEQLAAGELGPFSLLIDADRSDRKTTLNLMAESLRPNTTVASTECKTRNLNVVANQRDCVTAYGAGMMTVEEVAPSSK